MTLKHPDVASRTEYSLPFQYIVLFFFIFCLGRGELKNHPVYCAYASYPMVRDNMITLTSGGRRPPHREDENQESQRRPEPDLRGHDQHERLGVLSEYEHILSI